MFTGKELLERMKEIEEKGYTKGEAEQILWKEIARERGYSPTILEVLDLLKEEQKLRKMI